MNNEIPLSKAELEIAETCSGKPAPDYSETSFYHSFNADSARTITKKWHTENSSIPEVKKLIIEACKDGKSHLRIGRHLTTNECGVLKLDGFKVDVFWHALDEGLDSKTPFHEFPYTLIKW
jgi:hypothetical protein